MWSYRIPIQPHWLCALFVVSLDYRSFNLICPIWCESIAQFPLDGWGIDEVERNGWDQSLKVKMSLPISFQNHYKLQQIWIARCLFLGINFSYLCSVFEIVVFTPGPETIKKSGAWIGAQLRILCSINRNLRSGDYKEIGVRFLCSVWVSYSNRGKQISDSMNRRL